MRLTIDVTQDDIDAGTPCSIGTCPIALAVMRAVERRENTTPRVGVSLAAITFQIGRTSYKARTSMEAQAFIDRFDFPHWDGLKVKPFSFDATFEKARRS